MGSLKNHSFAGDFSLSGINRDFFQYLLSCRITLMSIPGILDQDSPLWTLLDRKELFQEKNSLMRVRDVAFPAFHKAYQGYIEQHSNQENQDIVLTLSRIIKYKNDFLNNMKDQQFNQAVKNFKQFKANWHKANFPHLKKTIIEKFMNDILVSTVTSKYTTDVKNHHYYAGLLILEKISQEFNEEALLKYLLVDDLEYLKKHLVNHQEKCIVREITPQLINIRQSADFIEYVENLKLQETAPVELKNRISDLEKELAKLKSQLAREESTSDLEDNFTISL